MRRYLVLALTIALVMVFVAPAASAADGPRDAIGQNVDSNGAFEDCGKNAVTNGDVTFRGQGAINTPGQGGEHANDRSAVSEETRGNCGDLPQRVEAPGIYTGL